MKISTRSRYGLRAMVCLAKIGKISPTNLIAAEEGISSDYLEKIFAKLKKAGLVKTSLGAQGGYILTRPAAQISVGEIIRALEGTMAPVCCVADEKEVKISCPRGKICRAKDVWKKIQDNLNNTLNAITLRSLIK